MPKLLRDEISLIEAVEVLSRRIEVLERDKYELQGLFTTQFHRTDLMARDHRRLQWLEDHPAMIDHFDGYWWFSDVIGKRFDTLRDVIDWAMKGKP